jgi:4-amino-4-deoxy-L-arabinose transferase-like glycosyltransferase
VHRTEILAWLLALLAALALYLPGIDRPLRDAESKYAQVPAEMVESGDWLTPRLNHATYYVKPPLTYWPTAALYRVFGVSEAAARLTTVLWALLSAALAGLLARQLFGPRAGIAALILFLTTTEVYVYCLDAGPEFGLIAFAILAMLGFTRWRETRRLAPLCLFHLALGLGFLAKGLPGVLIPLTAAVLHLIVIREPRALVRLFHPAGLASFAAVALPWVAVMTAQHAEFFDAFVVNEHLHRFTGSMRSNDALFPTGLWLVLIAAEFFPWVFHLPGGGYELARMVRQRAVERDTALLLGIWAAVPLVLYATSRSKVDFYGLEIYPPLLIALSAPLGDLLGEARFASGRRWAWPWLGIGSAGGLALAALLVGWDSAVIRDLGIPSLPAAAVFLASAVVFGFAAGVLFRRNHPRAALACAVLVCAVLFQVARVSYVMGFEDSSLAFGQVYAPLAREGDVLVSDERAEFEHVAGLVFYTGRQVLILRDREDSIMHFIEPDRDALCIDEPALAELVRSGRRVFYVGEPEPSEARFAERGLAWQRIGSGGERSFYLFSQTPEAGSSDAGPGAETGSP